MPSRNLEELPSAPLSIQTHVSDLPHHSSISAALIVGVALAAGAGAFIALLLLIFILRHCHKISKTSPSDAPLLKLQKFSYRELKWATSRFSEGSRVGQGGFGTVYRGVLRNGKSVAVKRLDTSSLQGERELQKEISVIGNVNSPHIVGLLGFCIHGRRRLLVYEFMENRSLQEALFDENYPVKLDWTKRFKIILDTANALAFLHSKCNPPIIHGDIKPSNILLDEKFSARIADFGLARIKSEISAEELLDQELMERERVRRDRMAKERKMRHRKRLESLKGKDQEQLGSESAKSLILQQPKELGSESAKSSILQQPKALCLPSHFSENSNEKPSMEGDSTPKKVGGKSMEELRKEEQLEGQMETFRFDEEKASVKSSDYVTGELRSGEDDDSSKISRSPHEEETEGDNHSKISQSEESRSEISQDSGLELSCTARNQKMLSKKKSSRDWWWRQESSGEFSLKEYIVDWVACDSSRDDERSRDWSWADETSVDGVSEDGKSKKRRKERRVARSGSLEWWAECDSNSTEFKRRVKRQERFKDKSLRKSHHTSRSEELRKREGSSRDWWKDESSREIYKRTRELSGFEFRSKERRDGSMSKESFSFNYNVDLSQSTDASKNQERRRARTRSKDWWSVELSRGRECWNGEGLSRREKNYGSWSREIGEELCQVKEDTSWERRHDRSRSRSRDWWNCDLFSRSGVSSTPSMRGTICYVAPEYGGGGILSEKSDVYSFGVLMLVIVSGRRPLQVVASAMSEFERANLISWARHAASAGRIMDIVDANLLGEHYKNQITLCISLALLCLQRLPAVRPTMAEVARILTGQVELPQLPLEFSPSPPSGVSPYKSCRKVSADQVSIDLPLLP